METIKVSVIVYVKNGETYIERCISSILNQSLRELEIILVDGGSEDDTMDIIRRFQKRDDRVKTFSLTKGSVGAQFNFGLSVAKGEYIAICEADDYVSANMYEVLYNAAKNNHCDVVKSDYVAFFEKNGKEYECRRKVSSDIDVYQRVLDGKDALRVRADQGGVWNSLYRRTFVLENNITMNETPGASFQDVSFDFLTCLYSEKYMYLDRQTYHYRQDNHKSSMYSNNVIEKIKREYELLHAKITNESEEILQIYEMWKKKSILYFTEAFLIDNPELELGEYNDVLGEAERVFVEETRKLTQHFDEQQKGKYVVYGCGNLGTWMKLYLDLTQCSDYILADNKKAGLYIGAREILNPAYVIRNYRDYKFIISISNDFNAVKTQLRDAGVSNENIYLCMDEDMILRRMLSKL